MAVLCRRSRFLPMDELCHWMSSDFRGPYVPRVSLCDDPAERWTEFSGRRVGWCVAHYEIANESLELALLEAKTRAENQRAIEEFRAAVSEAAQSEVDAPASAALGALVDAE